MGIETGRARLPPSRECLEREVVMLDRTGLLYVGSAIDDEPILERLPADLAGLIRETNGFIRFGGGLHVRGAVLKPDWHSLRNAWVGENSFQELYPGSVRSDDIPFAEDCFGDQFLLRDHTVWRLACETGDLDSLNCPLFRFFEDAESDPVESLSLQPLVKFQKDGGELKPGELLNAFPPYCIHANQSVSLRAIPAQERRSFLADFARQIADLPDGASIQFRVN